jgi:hypothetical protein
MRNHFGKGKGRCCSRKGQLRLRPALSIRCTRKLTLQVYRRS